ncbi:MAG: hypothetical protein Q8L34_05900 [Candidatus Woesearchaeota archaeon]|nr:hypothetical protein [Candidatus Woesearchaeota archaeon]
MKEVERISKSVLTADSIESRRGWSLAQKDNPVMCIYCKSPLFYVGISWGIVEEERWKDIKIFNKQREPQYRLQEIGLHLYCAECGHWNETYHKHFYPEDKLVCNWEDDELDYAEIEEIYYCLEQFNRRGDFTPRYSSTAMEYLKRKLKEYEGKLKKLKKSKKTIKK